MTFPAELPESMRKKLPPGVSLFPRPKKERWVMSLAPDWKQKTLPAEVTEPEAAVAYMLTFLRERGLNPGAEMQRRKVEGPTFGACADKWLALLYADSRCAPATFKNNRSHIELWLKPAFGGTPIAALDVPLARSWLRRLRAEKKNGRTVQHVVSSARVFYDTAMAEGWVNALANPFRHPGVQAEMPEPEESDPVKLPLDWVQWLVDCAAIPLERRARYVLAFTAGMRDGEIAGVRLERLSRDVAPPTVQIVESVATVGTKGPKAWAKPKAPKTKSAKRTLPLHRAADAAIGEWLERGWPVLVGRQPTPADYLFPRPDGGPYRPRSAEMLRADLALALREHKRELSEADAKALVAHVEFKSARSSFATWLDETGVDERVRKRLMGHRAHDVTEKHYTVRELSRLAEAVATIAIDWKSSIVAGTVPVDPRQGKAA